jgi:glutamyl-tRNA(Gln) amidotransferase subunit D
MAYSLTVKALLKKANVQPGDRVRVVSKANAFEGVLLPKAELGGNDDVLVLKLDNGYNVGVSLKGATVQKLTDPVAMALVEPLTMSSNPRVPKLSLVSTGGTISTRVDYATGGVAMLSEPSEILAKVPELADVANIHRIDSPFRKGSEDMDYTDWQTLAKSVVKELHSDSEGVIVTHGTDILGYTAAALSFMIQNQNKPVAVTGAQRSPDRGSFDGAMNLVCAAEYAKSDCAEVAVVMHGTSSDDYCLANVGTKVRKMHTSRRDAFRTINAQPWAKVWPEKGVQFLRSDYKKRNDGTAKADVKFEPKVAHIKPWPGASPDIIDFFVRKKYRGILLESWALGHVPSLGPDSWIPVIERAVEKGVVVAITTQSLYGRVHPNVYANSRKLSFAGVIHLQDVLPETAWVKLGWVLGHTKNKGKIRDMMLENIAHEFNSRLQPGDFLS